MWDFINGYHTNSDLHVLLMTGYRALYDDQIRIGWNQLFHGRCSKLWAVAVDRHLKTLLVDRRIYQGQIWTRKVITKIWDAMHLTWKERNNDLHRKKGAVYLSSR